MCAQFLLKTTRNSILERFNLHSSEDLNFNLTARGFMKTELAPILRMEENSLVLRNAAFSLCPPWSQKFPCDFSTYNARLERTSPKSGKVEYIYQVPSWKESFSSGKTCLVPVSGVIETSYFGKFAGNTIRFSTQSQDFFFCAGIYHDWVDKKSGIVHETFTLLTDDPYPYFFESGHDRAIVVLENSKLTEWLSSPKMSPTDRFQFLRDSRKSLDWTATIERPLKKGWEKRAPSPEEIAEVKVWKGPDSSSLT